MPQLGFTGPHAAADQKVGVSQVSLCWRLMCSFLSCWAGEDEAAKGKQWWGVNGGSPWTFLWCCSSCCQAPWKIAALHSCASHRPQVH